MIYNDYENHISIFIIPVAFHNRLYVKHPPDRQRATLRLDPAAALARRADRRRRLQSRRIGSGGRQPRKFRTDTAPVRCAEPVETGLQRRAYRLRTKSVTRFSRSGETGQPEPAFPDAQFLVYFIIPVKAKWLSIVYLLMDGYMFVRYLMSGYYYSAAVILVLLLNFFIFCFMGRGSLTPKQAYHQKKRKMEYKKKTAPTQGSVPRHHCVICGRTDVDSPQLEFRYCSKCEGNYEYCSEHLFTHEHVHH